MKHRKKRFFQKGKNKGSILPIKKYRPLDNKSIAHYAKILDIKRDTMTLKMGVSTFLTPLK